MRVTPRAGVWIEIARIIGVSAVCGVTPRADVLIRIRIGMMTS